ncbi:hypothetical protein BDY19DRAFT_660622 [Irpex rosettiformis]|uniref:Uncharacterized protein n=1 Tax=Irpex rosettiformis TaxID=378272 RepID=A0ACB8TN53_9APHY|nr:hypothetical protein BDY19DRAFT_660622 [Irpex rosettiformis]
MYKPASRFTRTLASRSSSVEIEAARSQYPYHRNSPAKRTDIHRSRTKRISSTHTHSAHTTETLPLNARISTEYPYHRNPPTEHTDIHRARTKRPIRRGVPTSYYERCAYGRDAYIKYAFDEEVIVHSMVLCLDYFYNMHQKMFDGIVKLAIEKQRSSFSTRLEKQHFDFNFHVLSYEINLFPPSVHFPRSWWRFNSQPKHNTTCNWASVYRRLPPGRATIRTEENTTFSLYASYVYD